MELEFESTMSVRKWLSIEKSPISRVDISKITKLTRSTVSSIVDYLIKKDLIKKIGLTFLRVGRKAVLLNFNSKKKI